MTGGKGAPVVGRSAVSDQRQVEVELSNCVRHVEPLTGHMFIPDRLILTYLDGRLVRCSLTGRRLRADGGEWIDGRRTGRSFVSTYRGAIRSTLDDGTPDWVRELADRFRPVVALSGSDA